MANEQVSQSISTKIVDFGKQSDLYARFRPGMLFKPHILFNVCHNVIYSRCGVQRINN